MTTIHTPGPWKRSMREIRQTRITIESLIAIVRFETPISRYVIYRIEAMAIIRKKIQKVILLTPKADMAAATLGNHNPQFMATSNAFRGKCSYWLKKECL